MAEKSVIKEWAPVVEALGKGKQIILIRTYQPAYDDFLLYPTYTFLRRPDIRNQLRTGIVNNAGRIQARTTVEIDYYAKVIGLISFRQNPTLLRDIEWSHIWTSDHLSSYVGYGEGIVWLLRVYRLNKPFLTQPLGGQVYSSLNELPISLDCAPVLSENEFMSRVHQLEKILGPIRRRI